MNDLLAGKLAPGLSAGPYFRIRSFEQVEGCSLDAQARSGRIYREAHGWSIAHDDRDGMSARDDDLAKRSGFTEMLVDAEVGQCNGPSAPPVQCLFRR